jgi:iron complex transport system ATP-binding protein
MTQPVLTLRDLSLTVRDRTLLRDITLSISQGEKVALVGANGAGKSSLLKVIAGLHPRYSGSAEIVDREVKALAPRERSRLVSFVLQRLPFVPRFTVHEFLELSELHDHTDLDPTVVGLRDRYLSDLSGGELQRVVLMGAVAQRAKLVLLDEPTAHLDPTGRSEVERVVQRYHHEQSISYLLVTHDIALATRLAERIVMMRQGAIVWDGSVTDDALPSMLREVYGCPFTKVAHPSTGESIIIPG